MQWKLILLFSELGRGGSDRYRILYRQLGGSLSPVFPISYMKPASLRGFCLSHSIPGHTFSNCSPRDLHAILRLQSEDQDAIFKIIAFYDLRLSQ